MNGGFLKFAASTSYYFRNYYRSRSFYLMLVISLLVSGLMTFFTLKYVNELPLLFPNVNLSNIGYPTKEAIFGYVWSFVLIDLPVFASVFFGSSAISSEIENKTAFHIFTLPISRASLLMSKYLAAVLVTIVTISVYLVIQAVTFMYVFPIPLIYNYFDALWLLIVFIFAMTAFTFMISSIFNKNTYAYITVFLIYFLIFNAYQVISEFLYRTTPFYLLYQAAGIVEKSYMNIALSPFNFSFSLSPAGTPEIIQSLVIMGIYTVVSLAVALIIFERKEVK